MRCSSEHPGLPGIEQKGDRHYHPSFPKMNLSRPSSFQVPRQDTRASSSSWLALPHRLALHHRCLMNRSAAPGGWCGSTRYNGLSFAVHQWVQKSPENKVWKMRNGQIGPELRISHVNKAGALSSCSDRTDRNHSSFALWRRRGLLTHAHFL